ncbi:hypothetical protein [Bacillus sp. 1P06AnD]|uniref:hypothetical protein n=1 Tax=Bacillus sp. 1P06AnD TaxID=3132208 RepID=UPI0039A33B00
MLCIEVGYQILHANKRAEEKNPVTKQGVIKEDAKVSLDEEEKIFKESIPPVNKKEQAEQMLTSFSSCLMAGDTLGDTGYQCLSNTVSDKAIEGLGKVDLDIEKGHYISEYLTKGKKVTDIRFFPLEEDSLTYHMVISLDYDSEVPKYKVQYKKKKIIAFTKDEGGEIDE